MYSRYIPRESGGFERRRLPDRTESPPPPPTAARPMGTPEQIPEIRMGGHDPSGLGPPQPGPGPPIGGGPGRGSAGPMRPGPGGIGFGPTEPGRGPGLGLFGPGSPLGRLLPRGLETEDLLVLAVLLLAMKQDGAAGTELLIAAALYLFL